MSAMESIHHHPKISLSLSLAEMPNSPWTLEMLLNQVVPMVLLQLQVHLENSLDHPFDKEVSLALDAAEVLIGYCESHFNKRVVNST
jgi:hypothetical protein